MSEKLKALSFLLGSWQTEGEVYTTENSEAINFNGTDTYESVLNGSFILHKVDVMMGEDRVEVIELIGIDNANPGTYLLHSFDNTGTVTAMQAVIENGVMNIYDETKRADLRPINNNALVGEWEKKEDAKWVKWMKLMLTRI